MASNAVIANLDQQIVDLSANLEKASARVAELQEALTTQRGNAAAWEKREKETRAQFADLKERLSNAEMENQRLRGYLARVQEDDVVREELVTTGDPDGEQQLQPKRKHSRFEAPSQYSEFGDMASSGYIERDRRKPKHWVTY